MRLPCNKAAPTQQDTAGHLGSVGAGVDSSCLASTAVTAGRGGLSPGCSADGPALCCCYSASECVTAFLVAQQRLCTLAPLPPPPHTHLVALCVAAPMDDDGVAGLRGGALAWSDVQHLEARGCDCEVVVERLRLQSGGAIGRMRETWRRTRWDLG